MKKNILNKNNQIIKVLINLKKLNKLNKLVILKNINLFFHKLTSKYYLIILIFLKV